MGSAVHVPSTQGITNEENPRLEHSFSERGFLRKGDQEAAEGLAGEGEKDGRRDRCLPKVPITLTRGRG